LLKSEDEDNTIEIYYAIPTKESEDKTDPGYGKLRDTAFEYVVIDEDTDFEKVTDVQGFYQIKVGEEGVDKVETNHYGNQIAYELLGLGYTVLYKRIVADDAEIEEQDKSEKLAALNTDEYWSNLKDKTIYDFRYIMTGLLEDNTQVNAAITKLAEERGDCIALLDINKDVYEGKTDQRAIVKAISNEVVNKCPNSKFAALFAPYVKYTNIDLKNEYSNKTFPASFHYLACAATAAENYSEWYAVAGYTRGKCNKYTVDTVGCRLGEIAINELEPRCSTYDDKNKEGTDKAINLVVKIKGSYYL
jgi:hypothetical protein